MYKVYGRPFAGSLIGEFLLTEANVDYQFIKIDSEYKLNFCKIFV